MDQRLLIEWREFCEGRETDVRTEFSSIFMGMFAEPLSKKDAADLDTVFSYIPNSSHTVRQLLRIGTRAKQISDEEIAELAVRDLSDKRRVIDNPQILTAIDFGVRVTLSDIIQYQQICSAPINLQFIDSLMDYYAQITFGADEKTLAICNAFYGISNNLQLQLALTADLLSASVQFDNYVELYLRGADIALDTSGAVVFIYRQ